jgi:hypothetical protein
MRIIVATPALLPGQIALRGR